MLLASKEYLGYSYLLPIIATGYYLFAIGDIFGYLGTGKRNVKYYNLAKLLSPLVLVVLQISVSSVLGYKGFAVAVVPGGCSICC